MASSFRPPRSVPHDVADPSALPSSARMTVIVSAHPGSLKLADFEAIKSQPVSFEFAEEDLILSDKVRDTGVDSLRKKGNEVEVKIYPGTTHGEEWTTFPSGLVLDVSDRVI